jgi:hypothetical protein
VIITQAGRQFARRVETQRSAASDALAPCLSPHSYSCLLSKSNAIFWVECSQTRREAGTQSLRSQSTRDSGVAGAEAGFEIATTCQSAKQPARSARADDRVRYRPTPMLRLMTSCEQQGFTACAASR